MQIGDAVWFAERTNGTDPDGYRLGLAREQGSTPESLVDSLLGIVASSPKHRDKLDLSHGPFAGRQPSPPLPPEPPRPRYVPTPPEYHPTDAFNQPLRHAPGTSALKLMPTWVQIPPEFRHGKTPWNQFAAEWFFRGFSQWPFQPKPGIDHKAAVSQLNTIQRSFDPQHEHKDAAVAYLLSLWYEPGKPGHKAGEVRRPKKKSRIESISLRLGNKMKGPLKGGLG